MKKSLISLLAGLALFGFAGTAQAANVATGASVTASNIWGGSPATLVDGTILPEGTEWTTGTVYWYWFNQNEITLNLTGTYSIDSFTVQADNNDTYELLYRDLSDNDWELAWTIPTQYNGGGMSTRYSGLLAPITTNALLFRATGGDNMYSVSEIQANGNTPNAPVPEPVSMVYGLITLAGVLGLRKRN